MLGLLSEGGEGRCVCVCVLGDEGGVLDGAG